MFGSLSTGLVYGTFNIKIHLSVYTCFTVVEIDWQIQLFNVRCLPNSVCIGFGPAMKKGSSRRFKQYPTAYVSFKSASLY